MNNKPFYTRRCELSDGSTLWEVWQQGSSQRLASSASRYGASQLAHELNETCATWAGRLENTVDA